MKRLILAVPVILLALLACNLSSQSPAAATGIQTLTALAENAAPNSTPQSDGTPGATSTGKPAVRVNYDLAACRTGPSTAYDNVDALPAGFEAEVVGIDASEDYLLIKLATGQVCWLDAHAATLNGDASALPEVIPPPTPTPHAPPAPQNLTGQVLCDHLTASGSSGETRYSIQLYWTDLADNETNYFVKAGSVVSQLPADASSFGIANRDVPAGESLTVQVIARNAAGENSVTKIFTCP